MCPVWEKNIKNNADCQSVSLGSIILCVCVCHTVSWRDAQPQRIARPPQDLGEVSVLQGRDRPALHSLQLVSGLDLTTASRRAATPHRHEAVGHQGGC